MNAAHFHLMLIHVPVLGTIFCFVLLAFGILKKNDLLMKTALGALVVVALLSIPAYLTGEPAEEIVERLPGVQENAIEPHEEAAEGAFLSVLVAGILALAGLLCFRKGRLMPRWFAGLVLILSLVSGVLMGRTAYLGGKIHHSELRTGQYSSGGKAEEDD